MMGFGQEVAEAVSAPLQLELLRRREVLSHKASVSLWRRFLDTDVTLARGLATAILLGVLTATSGVYIAINCDFLNDLRFGYCKGLPLVSRNRCCGGSENVNAGTGRCKDSVRKLWNSTVEASEVAEWAPWEEDSVGSFVVYLVVTVTLAVSAAVLLANFGPAAKGSGIPDVKAAVSGFSLPRSFSPMCFVCKTLGLSMAVGAGLALGKEGPLIHIGVCLAYMLASKEGLCSGMSGSIPLHEIICVGAATGVSTAFGAPVGGVLFAVEELGSVRPLSQRVILLAFAGSVTASFVLKAMNLNGSNQLTFFQLATPTSSPSKEWQTWEISVFVLLGVIGGLVGSLFVKLNLAVAIRRKKNAEVGRSWLIPLRFHQRLVEVLPRSCLTTYRTSKKSGSYIRHDGDSHVTFGLSWRTVFALEATLIAIGTAFLNYHLGPLLRHPMVEVIHALFETCPDALATRFGLCDEHSNHGFAGGFSLQVLLLSSAAVRFAQTVVTFGAMLPAGLFIPSLYIGAVIGRLVGLWALTLNMYFADHTRTSPVNPSAFAMVGALAVLGGFARMTVSLAVIMLELTGEVTYAIPFMCAVLSAKLVGDSLTPSIYDGVAILLGYTSFEDPPPGVRLASTVSDVAVACRPSGLLDASTPRTLQELEAAVVEDSDDEGRDRCAAPSLTGRWSRFEPLDLVVLTDGSKSKVRGIILKERLRRWLSVQDHPANASCSFQTLDVDDQAVKAAELDVSDLIETNFQRLLAEAPLLTAVCAFREFSELTYCVCRSESGEFSVLSRHRLEDALIRGKFAGSFHDEIPPVAGAASLTKGGRFLGNCCSFSSLKWVRRRSLSRLRATNRDAAEEMLDPPSRTAC